MTRKQYIKHMELMAGINHVIESPEDHIQKLINRIIQTMYVPVPDERQFIVGMIDEKIRKDAVNWGDLRCVEVVACGGNGYTATIEEADPGAHNLCGYIERLLESWGWDNVSVVTEW